MSDIPAAGDKSRVRLPKRRWSRLRIVLPFAVLIGLYLLVVAPFLRTLWIMNQVETAGRSSSVRTEPGGPAWLRDMLSEHWMRGFDHITRLRLHVDDQFDTARLLACLKPHSRVESLNLNSPTACDDSFGRLDCLPQLKTLRLEGGILTDDGMRHLRGCESLTTLHLTEVSITDDGMQHLRHCESLTTLHLTGLGITDAGIEPLGSLSSLEELHISECPGLTDEGMRHLAPATGVTELRLSGQQFTDESLGYLADMQQLRMLNVVDTGITTAGATRLSDALPQCTIVWSEDGTVCSNRIVNVLGN